MDYSFVTTVVARKPETYVPSKNILALGWLESILVRSGQEAKENKNNCLTQTCVTQIFWLMQSLWTIYFTYEVSHGKS
jgi:hypothetical protein